MQVLSLPAEPAYRLLFESLPGNFLVLSPQLIVVTASNTYLENAGISKAALVGKPVASLYLNMQPAVVAEQVAAWQNALAYVQAHRVPHAMAAMHPGVFKQNGASGPFWQQVNNPVFSDTGELAYIIHEIKDITTEHQAIENARYSQERFNLVGMATNDAVWDWNLRDNSIYWNEGYKTLFGYKNPEPTIHSWYDYIHPDDRERVIERIHQVINQNHRFWNDEYRFICADGSYSSIMDRGYILYDASNTAYRMVGSMQDVSLYKKAQQQIKDNANFFQFLADTIPAFIWTSEPDGHTDYRNEYYLNFVGRGQARQPDFSWPDLLPPTEKENTLANWQANINAGKPFEEELQLRNASGEYRWVLAKAFPKYNAEGKVFKWLGTAIDIHTQKTAKLALEESYQRFKFLADMVPVLIWTSNPDGETDYRNQNYYRFIGDESANNPEFDWTQPLHPDDRTETYNRWTKSVRTGQLFEIEHRLRHHTGEYRWILSRAEAMRDQSGQIVKWFGSSADIHEQKQFQQELQDRETWLQRLLSEAPVLFFVLRGPNLVCTFMNPNMVQFYNNQSFIGVAARDAWPNLVNQEFIQVLENVYTTGQPFVTTEYQININKAVAESPTNSFLNISVQPLRDVNGQVEGVLCFAVEVTGQVNAKNQAEALAGELRHETEKFKLLSEAVPQLVWTAQPDGRIDYLNQQWITYTGVAWQAEKGHGLLEALHPDDYAHTLAVWHECLPTGKPLELEYRLRNAAGQYRWHLARGLALKDTDGNIIKWCGTCTDIHDQKFIQQKLQESNDRFRFLAEAMPQKVWTAKAGGEVNYYNQQWLQYTGLALADLKDWGWEKIMHPADLPAIVDTWQNSLATGTDFQIENRLRRADGAYRWHLTRAIPMHNDQGQLTMWLGTNTDINDQKITQENLQEANAELKRINEDLDRFVYTASHDLKLPIINMGSLFDEIMYTCEFKDPDHAKLVAMFHKSLDQINATISDLSEITKVQKNINAEKEKINLAQLTEETCLSIQDMIQQSAAQINVNFATAPYLEFSKANLRSILYNLISNAIKYRSPNRVPEVYISTAVTPGFYVLEVKDNGLGINLDRHKDKLFQMFKRFHSHVPGTGLGLYMINRIMQNNNGHIEVESNLDSGSTFRIYFRKD